jgi:hypothetical protein
MKKIVLPVLVLSALVLSFISCGVGGTSSPPPTPVTIHPVTLTWAPNHEKGVNSAGGGYQVTISGQPAFDVPYTAPTSTTVLLKTGTYSVSVRAFAALDAQGGSAGSLSAPSTITVRVP